MARRILLVAYRFPPQGGGGVQRPAKMVKAWCRRGARVGVLTASEGRVAASDHSLLADVPPEVERAVVFDPSPWLVIRRLRRALPASGPARSLDRALVVAGGVVELASVPDTLSGWLPSAVVAGFRLAKSIEPEVVVVTGPPFTAFVAGLILARLVGVPLVLDYRDPWTASYLPESARGARRLANPSLERAILARADGVVAAHRAVFRELRRSYPDALAAAGPRLWAPNGFDESDFAPANPGPAAGTFTITYTGSFYAFRDPAPFFRALEGLLADGTLDERRVALRIAGGAEGRELSGLGERTARVTHRHGYVPHADSVDLIRSSTVNWVLEGVTGGANDHSPGKLYEVLRAGRPVLLLCPEGVSTRLARAVGGCTIRHPQDVDGIRAALARLFAAWRDGEPLDTPDPSRLGFYERDRQGARVLRFIDRVVRASGRSA